MIRFLALALLALPLMAPAQTGDEPQLPIVVGVWTCNFEGELRWKWVDQDLSGAMWLLLVDKRVVLDDPCGKPYMAGDSYPSARDFFQIIPSREQQIAIREFMLRGSGGQ